jgi:hypothetical protein
VVVAGGLRRGRGNALQHSPVVLISRCLLMLDLSAPDLVSGSLRRGMGMGERNG